MNAVAPEQVSKMRRRPSESFLSLANLSMYLNLVLVVALFVLIVDPPQTFLLSETNGRFYQQRGPLNDPEVRRGLMRNFAVRYVLAREEFDGVTDTERLGWVKDHSRRDVIRELNAGLVKGTLREDARRARTTWKPRIVNVWQSNAANPDIWSVEFARTYTAFNRITTGSELWVGDLKLGHGGPPRSERDRLENPARLIVTAYTAVRKEEGFEGNER